MGHRLLSNQPGRLGVTAVSFLPARAARAALCRLVLALALVLASCAADGSCNQTSLTSCLSCAAGTGDCNHITDDGCEVDTLTDPNHCGRCDKACPGVGQQRGLCVHGVCSTCPSGRLDCNGIGDDGCETKVSSDPQNCGVCGMVCPAVRNGVAGCIDSNCTIGYCNQGFEDCDGNPLDGCETDTRTDPNNCGGCSVPCGMLLHTLPACASGMCKVSNNCEPGYADCNNDSKDGCEIAQLTDAKNCGGCTNSCGSGQSCVNGKCLP